MVYPTCRERWVNPLPDEASSTKWEKFLGEGVFLQQEFPKVKEKQPYNKGKKYFVWSIATTILLLKECLDKDISAVNL